MNSDVNQYRDGKSKSQAIVCRTDRTLIVDYSGRYAKSSRTSLLDILVNTA